MVKNSRIINRWDSRIINGYLLSKIKKSHTFGARARRQKSDTGESRAMCSLCAVPAVLRPPCCVGSAEPPCYQLTQARAHTHYAASNKGGRVRVHERRRALPWLAEWGKEKKSGNSHIVQVHNNRSLLAWILGIFHLTKKKLNRPTHAMQS